MGGMLYIADVIGCSIVLTMVSDGEDMLFVINIIDIIMFNTTNTFL